MRLWRRSAGIIGAAIVLALVASWGVAQQISQGGVLSTLQDYVVNGQWSFLNGITIGGTQNGSGPGYANSDRFKVYRVDSILNAVATDVFTVTVPDATNAAVIPVVIMASNGSGGTLGEFECVGIAYGQIVIQRTLDAATVKGTATLTNTATACTLTATQSLTVAYSTSSLSGAATGTQTFTMTITITRGGGSTTNHHAIVRADVLNAQASGITIS